MRADGVRHPLHRMESTGRNDILGERVGTVTSADRERVRPRDTGFFRKLVDRPLGGAS